MYKQIYYALKEKSSKINKDFMWGGIYDSIIKTKFCGDGPYFKIKVREAEKGEKSDYWGWKDFERKNYSMIYPSRVQAEICFPYGYKVEEEKGKGKLMNLVIEEIEEVKEE